MRYYVQNETMESIARHLQLSRSSVSRLLAEARSSGMVRISVAAPQGSSSPEARSLAMIFGIRVHLVAVGNSASIITRFQRVSKLAAALLRDNAGDGKLIGVAWGMTMSNIVPYLEKRPLHDATVVQMNGGNNASDSSSRHVTSILQAVATNFDAHIVPFPVPTFFDHAETKDAMWRERSVRNVLEYQSRIDLAIFGVGSMYSREPSYLYTAGFLDDAELNQMKGQGVVGDVCSILLRENGTYQDIPLNHRSSGMTPAELRRIPKRIGVVADPSRASVLLGALRAGTITDLVCDDSTARALLDRLDSNDRRAGRMYPVDIPADNGR